jgi:NSS family neurotransmitter:Na+ symporter
MDRHRTWKTRTGFILAAVGSAVGLGNIWRFPFVAGQEGGGEFLVVYILCVFAIGFPLMLAEFAIGRKTGRSVVGAFEEVGEGIWEYFGWFLVASAFLLLSYYTVVAGWVLRYAGIGVISGYPETVEAASTGFADVSVGLDTVLFHGIFIAGTVAIVALGVRRGIELAAKVMVPALVVLLGIMAYYAYGLSGAGEAYAYYLTPDLGVVVANWTSILPAAAGQAFFNLALGMGVMITYSSYIDREENLLSDAGIIIAVDTVTSIAVGLVVFPVLFTAGIPPSTSSHGTVLITLAASFGKMTGGGFLGVVFFTTVVVAALLSTVSLLEVIVSHMREHEEFVRSRRAVTAGAGLGLFVVGTPTALSLGIINIYDLFLDRILLVMGSLLLAVYVGWWFNEEAVEEVSKGAFDLGRAGKVWIWTLRVPIFVVLVIALLFGMQDYVEAIRNLTQNFIVEQLR